MTTSIADQRVFQRGRMSHAAGLLIAALLSGPAQAGEPGTGTMLDDLSARLVQWNARGIDSYGFKIWWAGPKGRLGPAEIVVKDGKIVSARYLTRSSESSSWELGAEVEADSKLRKTIPQLFAIASESLKTGARTRLGYDYDGTYEFPTEILSHPSNAKAFVYKIYEFVAQK